MSLVLRPGAPVLRGKYRLLRRLAVGGMAEVWAARNEATGASVAVKLCESHPATDVALRFRQEARVSAMLSHRSVVRIFDLVEEPDGTLLLVMELLRGQTLGQRLRSTGPLPTREGLAVVVPVLSALAHAHAAGIVHRDITPENIFLALEPDGFVIPKLVDFGIAKVRDEGVRTIEGTVLGTPRYMAPEQIRAQGVDGRSDLFSVGVVLYETLTNRSPFEAASPAASIAAVLEAVVDPDPLIEVPIWVEVQRALAKRPYERHRSAREMADRLLAAAGETEPHLSEVLREAPPAPPESGDALPAESGDALPAESGDAVLRGSVPQVSGSILTPTVGAAASATTGMRRVLSRRAWTWIVAGAVASASAVGGFALSRSLAGAGRRSSPAPLVQVRAADAPAAVVPSAPTAPATSGADGVLAIHSAFAPAASLATGVSEAPTAAASGSAKAPGSKGGPPPRARHPKPIGTVPGF